MLLSLSESKNSYDCLLCTNQQIHLSVYLMSLLFMFIAAVLKGFPQLFSDHISIHFGLTFSISGSTEASGNVCCDMSASISQAAAKDGTGSCSSTPVAEESSETSSSPPTAAEDSRACSSTPTAEDGAGSSSGAGGGGSGTGRMATAAGTPEPVLSLHYSTEGTTTSTIKLDFTDEW